jgi:T-complex protein 1 subunit gamma
MTDNIITRYFTFLTECTSPKACTILLRGPSKDILNEIDRNLADAMSVARNVVFHPFLSPGGGATEMAIAVGLHAKARSVTGVEVWPFRAVADAMEVIPRTLVQNSGGNAIRVLTELRVGKSTDSTGLMFTFFFARQNTPMVKIHGVLTAIAAKLWT